MLTINELSKTIGTYLQPEQVNKVQLAYQFSAEAHEGQKRKSGEPYIYHPLEVANILGDMRMDYQTLVAAILHDVMEDTPTLKTEIRKKKVEFQIWNDQQKLTEIRVFVRPFEALKAIKKFMVKLIKKVEKHYI